MAVGADLRSWETERKTVEDGKDDEGKPKQKTTTRWKMFDELSSKSAAWILSLDADAKVVAAGNEAGEVIVWRGGEKEPWQRFMPSHKVVCFHFLSPNFFVRSDKKLSD